MYIFLKNTLLTSLIISLICSSLCQIEDDPCTTPDKAPGNCVNLMDCESLYSELQASTQRTISKIHEKLKKHSCGFDKFTPKVCCPNVATNIEINTGGITLVSKTDTSLPPDVTKHRNLQLLPTECGLFETDRITKGKQANLNEFPWMVLISYNIRGDKSFKCGGTIINSRYILTAAHCIAGAAGTSLSFVRVGEHDVNTVEDCSGKVGSVTRYCASPVQDILIGEVIPHPNYSKSKLTDDIGLLRLRTPVNLTTDNADSICLPVTKELRDINLENNNVTVAGWGVTENGTASSVLLQVSLPIVPITQCQQIHNRSVPGGITLKQICAGGKDGQDSCGGDSGGPLKLVHTEDFVSRYVQHGVVSFGPTKCGSSGIPGVYTKVAYYMDWILDQLKP